MKFSSLTQLEVVILTISRAAFDENTPSMTITFSGDIIR